MITDSEIKRYRDTVEAQLNELCNSRFRQWQGRMRASLDGLEVPESLRVKLDSFIHENQVAFFIGYKEKLREKFKESIPIMVSTTPATNAFMPSVIMEKRFDEHRDRVFVETFLRNKGNGRRTAMALGVPKSTFHDWLKNHKELIRAELNKTKGAI